MNFCLVIFAGLNNLAGLFSLEFFHVSTHCAGWSVWKENGNVSLGDGLGASGHHRKEQSLGKSEQMVLPLCWHRLLQRLLPPSQELARLIQEVCKWLSDHPMADICLTPAPMQVWQAWEHRPSAQHICPVGVLNICCIVFPLCDKPLWETCCCYFSIATWSVSPCIF